MGIRDKWAVRGGSPENCTDRKSLPRRGYSKFWQLNLTATNTASCHHFLALQNMLSRSRGNYLDLATKNVFTVCSHQEPMQTVRGRGGGSLFEQGCMVFPIIN